MSYSLAPSEIPGVSSGESSIFGQIAEDLIYADLLRKCAFSPRELYVDHYNQGGYLFFLKSHNPELLLLPFAIALAETELGMKRPDILIHTLAEKVFYEIKPNSISGIEAGIEKVGILSATYKYFDLPYRPGLSYRYSEIIVASFASQLIIKLKAELKGPGLIVYKLCVESKVPIEIVTLVAVLKYVVNQINKQRRTRVF